MKKLLGIVVMGLFLSSNVYGAKLETKKSPADKSVRDYFSKMTVADIIDMAPGALQEITSNEDGVQYHFFMNMKEVSGPIPIVCFVSSKSTTCRVP
tara:strand:+ start:926 stop:1213 length:288 start_codon:yes stop_codon:yes gene_type:complete